MAATKDICKRFLITERMDNQIKAIAEELDVSEAQLMRQAVKMLIAAHAQQNRRADDKLSAHFDRRSTDK